MMLSNGAVIVGHIVALGLLGVWGVVEVGSAGTLTVAFWFSWVVYAGLLLLMYNGSKVGGWLTFIPPFLWAVFSGSDIVPQVAAALAGAPLSSNASVGALLITLPCAAAASIHLAIAATTRVKNVGHHPI